jgi:hypothetical protein
MPHACAANEESYACASYEPPQMCCFSFSLRCSSYSQCSSSWQCSSPTRAKPKTELPAGKPESTMESRIEQPQQKPKYKHGRTKRPSQRPEPSEPEPTDDVRTLSAIIFFFSRSSKLPGNNVARAPSRYPRRPGRLVRARAKRGPIRFKACLQPSISNPTATPHTRWASDFTARYLLQ